MCRAADGGVGRSGRPTPRLLRIPSSAIVARVALAILAVGLARPDFAAANPASSSVQHGIRSIPENPSGAVTGRSADQQPLGGVGVRGDTFSADVRAVVDWVNASGDNHALPFVIVDKVNARVFVFDRQGGLRGAAPALLGLAQGDDSVPGIGHRKLATITPQERTTPAGRFVAALGRDFEQDILWIDYDAALSLHRVIVGNPRDRRAQRLASPSPQDNRISFGCINVPAAFYDNLVVPAFKGTVGIVYILPDTKPIRDVFPLQGALKAAGGASHPAGAIKG